MYDMSNSAPHRSVQTCNWEDPLNPSNLHSKAQAKLHAYHEITYHKRTHIVSTAGHVGAVNFGFHV